MLLTGRVGSQQKNRKKLWWLLLIPVALFFGVFFGLQPLVDWKTKQVLAIFEGYTATYKRARLQPLHFNYALIGLKLVKESAGGEREPFVSIDKIQLSVLWRELLHFRL